MKVIDPTIYPSLLSQVNSRRMLRIRKRSGGRWLYFVPGLVIKVATTDSERRALSNEHAQARLARRSGFWKAETLGNFLLSPSMLVTGRGRNTTPADHAPIAGFAAGKRRESAGYPHADALSYVEDCTTFRTAPAERRRRFAEVLRGQALPLTSGHGDFHFMNFVWYGGRMRVIDWEFFEPEGTFLFDYLSFHLHPEAAGTAPGVFLATLEPTHPAIRAASEALDVEPEAVLLSYALSDLSRMIERLGGPEALSAQTRGTVAAVMDRLQRI